MNIKTAIQTLESVTAALSCCEFVKFYTDETPIRYYADKTQTLLKKALKQALGDTRLNRQEFLSVRERIVRICDVLFPINSGEERKGYGAAIIAFGLYILEDIQQVDLFDKGIRTLEILHRKLLPDTEKAEEEAAAHGKKAYDTWKGETDVID